MLRQHAIVVSITAREFATLGQRAEKTLDQCGIVAKQPIRHGNAIPNQLDLFADIGQRVPPHRSDLLMSLGVSGAASMRRKGTPGIALAAYRNEEEELWIEPVLFKHSNVARWPVSPKVLTAIFLPIKSCSVLISGLFGKQLVGRARLVGVDDLDRAAAQRRAQSRSRRRAEMNLP